jgi:hypothetical protein
VIGAEVEHQNGCGVRIPAGSGLQFPPPLAAPLTG